MNRIVLACHGVPVAHGPEAAADITNEFAEHRTWQKNARCSWDGSRLILEAENDNDPNGTGLAAEFSDCVAAYIPGTFGYNVTVESVTPCA